MFERPVKQLLSFALHPTLALLEKIGKDVKQQSLFPDLEAVQDMVRSVFTKTSMELISTPFTFPNSSKNGSKFHAGFL
jgi:hypothetical protein